MQIRPFAILLNVYVPSQQGFSSKTLHHADDPPVGRHLAGDASTLDTCFQGKHKLPDTFYELLVPLREEYTSV